jgi:gluconolactonase
MTGLDTGRIVCDGLLFPEGPVALSDGAVLVVEIAAGQITRIEPDGTKSVLCPIGGGPNGMAVGPNGMLYVCNAGGSVWRNEAGLLRPGPGNPPEYTSGRIEIVDPATGHAKMLYDRCGDRMLRAPNDIVFDRHGGFYFTDFGRIREHDRDHGGVYYALADGSDIRELVFPISMPNGIGLSPDGSAIYVAETETARLWAFDLDGPGVVRKLPFPSPHGGRLVCGLPGFHRFDSLAVTGSGRICIATLSTGCITIIDADGGTYRQVSVPDPLTTNICFGGPDLKTAYITLSGTGRLLEMEWEEPGLRLNYEL